MVIRALDCGIRKSQTKKKDPEVWNDFFLFLLKKRKAKKPFTNCHFRFKQIPNNQKSLLIATVFTEKAHKKKYIFHYNPFHTLTPQQEVKKLEFYTSITWDCNVVNSVLWKFSRETSLNTCNLWLNTKRKNPFHFFIITFFFTEREKKYRGELVLTIWVNNESPLFFWVNKHPLENAQWFISQQQQKKTTRLANGPCGGLLWLIVKTHLSDSFLNSLTSESDPSSTSTTPQ